MNRTWAKREKQIETIVSSTAKFTGELQALYGLPAAVATIRAARRLKRGIRAGRSLSEIRRWVFAFPLPSVPEEELAKATTAQSQRSRTASKYA